MGRGWRPAHLHLVFGGGGTGVGIRPSRSYADNGLYTAQLTVSDDEGLSATASCRVEIANVPPGVQGPWEPTIIVGEVFSASDSFMDPGADTWTSTVDYGDRSGVQVLPLSEMTFALNHIYTAAGTYTLTIAVADDDGGSEPFETTAFVITPQQAIAAISSTIDDLIAAGELSADSANSLDVKLGAAIRRLDDRQSGPGVKQLGRSATSP